MSQPTQGPGAGLDLGPPPAAAPGRDAPTIPDVLPVLPLQDSVVFPDLTMPVLVGRPRSLRLVEAVMTSPGGERLLAVVALRQPVTGDAEPSAADLYDIGTVARVVQMFRTPQGAVQLVLAGIERIKVEEITGEEPYFTARVRLLPDTSERSDRTEALVRTVRQTFRELAELSPAIEPPVLFAALNIDDPSNLADFLAANTGLDLEARQELLSLSNVEERLQRLGGFLRRELDLVRLGVSVQREMEEELRGHQREAYLRRQLDAIRKELGETEERSHEVHELRERVERAGLPEEARKAAERELERLGRMPPGAPDHSITRTYLEWLIELPWSVSTEDHIDVNEARKILDEDHYDLEKVKERILEYLAVRQLKADMRGPILCFVGPPGVGKTSLGQSIARAMGRRFVRMSLGGVRDEAEIRGHRRTYVGALPGRIMQGIRRAGSNNPVMMLDEVDKLGMDFRGDPSAALLEVLDPEQNASFSDHYVEVPFDLSRVLFIATANQLDPIPPALRDRMEVIELAGYTLAEKEVIARRHLLPRQLREHGLEAGQLTVTDPALRAVVRSYTREAGVRNLDRTVAALCRKAAVRIATGEARKVTIRPKDLPELLGPPPFHEEALGKRNEVGVAAGLAWTPAGGDVLMVEAVPFPGEGRLVLTGSLGDVMKESAQAAWSYARARAAALGADPEFHKRHDIHVHVPAGAIPKDGPSAGVTIATAIISAVTGRPVRRAVAMTGEITLRGKVLPVGGIKEKVLAAHRAGARTVLLPAGNEKDLRDVPAEVLDDLKVVLVEEVGEVLEAALASARGTGHGQGGDPATQRRDRGGRRGRSAGG